MLVFGRRDRVLLSGEKAILQTRTMKLYVANETVRVLHTNKERSQEQVGSP